MNILGPTLIKEVSLLETHEVIAGMDEVGRGALAGPVGVGVALLGRSFEDPPVGLTDSKLLTARRREALVEPIKNWVLDSAVGYSSAAEIDEYGIVVALQMAGMRALGKCRERGNIPTALILDGTHDWLSLVPEDLFSSQRTYDFEPPLVSMVKKGDRSCALVAAAAVLAKVDRDRYMCQLTDPGYGWSANKGYGAKTHIAGLKKLGVSSFHRSSWRLPGKTS